MLPELPRKLNKKEASWTTTVFRKWVEQNGMTAVFEIKYARKDYLAFSEVAEHQVQSLFKVRHSTFVYKIPDMGEKSPFDLFSMKEMPAYIVIKYPKFFCLISIDHFVMESKKSKRRSLTSKRASEVAWKVIPN